MKSARRQLFVHTPMASGTSLNQETITVELTTGENDLRHNQRRAIFPIKS